MYIVFLNSKISPGALDPTHSHIVLLHEALELGSALTRVLTGFEVETPQLRRELIIPIEEGEHTIMTHTPNSVERALPEVPIGRCLTPPKPKTRDWA